ncbi:hypothetical protein DFH09DRAFT_929956, partial [Mycena vulgaris]
GDDRDLETAVEKLIKAESLLSWGHNAGAAIAANMSLALAERFKRHGIIAHLKHSIELQQEALDLLPHSLPESAHGLNNLSIALQKLFLVMGDPADLGAAVESHRPILLSQGFDQRPFPNTERSLSLKNLVSIYFPRFTRQGDLADLEKLIKLHREFIDISPLPLYPTPVR